MDYYSREPSSDFFMHYGIKGMKWGVRRAIVKGGEKALRKQYIKASRKLDKLNKVADINYQKNIVRKYGKAAKISGGIGAGLALGSVGAHHFSKLNAKNFDRDISALYAKVHPGSRIKTINAVTGDITYSPRMLNKDQKEAFIINNTSAENLNRDYYNRGRKLNDVKKMASLAGGIGLGISAATGARALAAKRHTTVGGHAAAVAKRNEFQREMNKAFAGTKYASKPKKRRT